jgi:phosphotransferase system HPr (HPr) family protein
MSEELQFECPLVNGIHARPASALEELASRFVSSVAIVNGRNQLTADAGSVLSIVSADISSGDPCTVTITGADEMIARDAGLLRCMLEFVSGQGRTAAGAIAGAAEHFSSLLRSSASNVVRERALDVQDVCMKLLREIGKRSGRGNAVRVSVGDGGGVMTESFFDRTGAKRR